MKEFENIISLTQNLNVTQRIRLKNQILLVQSIKSPEIDKFLIQTELICENTNMYIRKLSVENDEIVSEVLAEMKEMRDR